MALTKIPANLLDKSAHVDFADNERLRIGTGNDLQIFHDSTNSIIDDTGNGILAIRTNGDSINLRKLSGNAEILVGKPDGAVELYHSGSKKLETSSTGATVTGNLAVTGDLDITGNVNSASVTDLDVTDKTITLGVGQTEAQSGGSGIIIDGSAASITWDESNDRFELNKALNVDLKLTVDSSSTTDVALELGGGTSSNHYTYIDLVSDATYTDYGLRIIRNNSGANTSSGIHHRGTGNLFVRTDDSAPITFLTNMNGGGAERMRISPTGHVGIGTNNPQFPLHISTSSTDVAKFQTSGSYTYTRFQNSSKTWALSIGSDFGFYDEAASATRMIIDSSGNVGIGTTSPKTDLDVVRGGATGLSSVNARTVALFQNNNSAGTVISVNAPNTGYSGIFLGDPENEAQGQIKQIHTDNSLQFCTQGGLTEMTLKNGQVGIGTTSPLTGVKLDVRGGNIHVGGYGSGSDYGIRYSAPDNSSHWYTYADTGGELVFGRSGTIGQEEKVRIDSDGRLLAGKTSVGARNAHTFARSTSFAGEFIQQIASAGGSVLGLTFDGAAPNNTTDYFLYARDTTGVKYQLYSNGSTLQTGNITTNGQITSNHIIRADAGHNTARVEAVYDDQNASNPQYNSNILMWVSEPGITYDSGGIGVNVNTSGQYYGRKYNYGYSTYMQFKKSDGNIIFFNNQGTAGTAGASQTEMLRIEQDGNLRLAVNAGVRFGTANAADTLDDYEEGNFTPIFATAGGSAPTSQTGTGQYTKIGDVVHLTGQISWSGAGSGGVNLRIAIPFNLISDARAGMAIGLNSGVSYTSGHMLHLIPEINTNVIYLVSSPTDGSGHDHLNFSNVTNSGSRLFSFSGTFHTRD